MTPESVEVANEMDRYPEYVRQKMRDSFMRLADAYAATGARTWVRLTVAPHPALTEPGKVLQLFPGVPDRKPPKRAPRKVLRAAEQPVSSS